MIGRAIKAQVMPYLWGALALGVIGVCVWIYSAGGDRVLRKVEKQNDKAEAKADIAALGYDECNLRRADGERVRWDFAAGKCEWSR